MVKMKSFIRALVLFGSMVTNLQAQQTPGGVRGTVYDEDFNTPLGGAQVLIVETNQAVTVSDQGNFVFEQVTPGVYTLVFTKEGYERRVKGDVIVNPGEMTELDASLFGEFVEMDEYIVQYVEIGSDTEAALLQLRLESPALTNAISAGMMSQAGASDAAAALNLVSGATVSEGKYAVVRGLPDRYVNSQLNGVRLPTADEDKRAVELDLYPTAVIDNIQVSKTFTPDQQGDASGGAVNVILKGIPDENLIKLDLSPSFNTQNIDGDFLTYKDGGFDYLGNDDGSRDQQLDLLGESWNGAVGVSDESAPLAYKYSITAGGRHELTPAIKIGGLVNFFYDRDSSTIRDGKDDRWWVENPGDPMTPQFSQGTPDQDDFKSSLFDINQGNDQVKWGGLGVAGIETPNNRLSLTYLYSQVSEDVATLAEDTRGKEFYFPGYDPDDPADPGNQARFAAPYLRTQTLEYSKRTAQTLQLSGQHWMPIPEYEIRKFLKVLKPEINWYLARSSATLDQPDKRQFGSLWLAESLNPGFPPFVPPFREPEIHYPYKPAANFTVGNFQRVWKEIEEDSDQYAINLKLPFEQWTGTEGYWKFGYFNDDVTRTYNQDSFSNFNDNGASFPGPWEEFWSDDFSDEDHPITAADIDVDYEGNQKITALYYMLDLPLTDFLKITGGQRFESTELTIVNTPEEDVTWIPPGAPGPVALNPGDADVFYEQEDVLPSIGLEVKPMDQVTVRLSYSETVARQTFKELSPIQQQEFLGGEVFIGNPFLRMSALKNYDLRVDYEPFAGSLVSASYFHKDITDPIEYVQRIADFAYTTAVNYPEGKIDGVEFEVRQEMGKLWDRFEGLTLGANATFISSEVLLPLDEQALLEQPNVAAAMKSRDMTNAPEHLYNLYMIYDLDRLRLRGTQLGVFYTVRGDTLVAGAGQSNGNFIPNVYELEYGTLNLSLTQKFGDNSSLKFQAKNLLDPVIESVYRSELIGDDVTKTSYQKGMEFSVGFTYTFSRKPKSKSEPDQAVR